MKDRVVGVEKREGPKNLSITLVVQVKKKRKYISSPLFNMEVKWEKIKNFNKHIVILSIINVYRLTFY